MLTTIGLILDLAGVVMLFKYPPLAPAHERSAGTRGISHPKVDAENAEKAQQRRRYTFLSKVALALMAIGFFLQILGMVLPVVEVKVTDVLSAMADIGTLIIGMGAVFISWTAYKNSKNHMSEVENHALMSIKPALSTWAEYPTEKMVTNAKSQSGTRGLDQQSASRLLFTATKWRFLTQAWKR